MNDESKQKTIMECSVSYLLNDLSGQTLNKGDAQIRLEEESISILPKFGEPLFFSLRDIVEISESDYKIRLTLTSKEKLTIFDLGYKYEDFCRVLSHLRNEVLLKDMLMHETLKKSGTEAEFICFDEYNNEKQRGKCEPRLYETAVVVIPEKGELIRISYSDISEVQSEDFTLAITTDFGEKFIFFEMGKQFDPFTQTLSDSINELSLKVQSSLKELLPKSDPSIIRRAARFMKEGKAARRIDLESISPELWIELEKKLESTGVKEEYDFLKSFSQKEKICIGLKRGLLGDLTGEYIWFLIPIYSANPNEPGNAVAMEAISGEGGGKATYFFRIVSRSNYSNFKNLEDLHLEIDNFIKRINRCMLAINFRREPIYLPDERLEEPEYQKYKFAISKIQALHELRQLFIGRVIHSSYEQWKEDVMDLLRFNISTIEDSAKWKKTVTDVTGYITKLDFDPLSLKDITDTPEGSKIFRSKLTEGEIPPKSKIHLAFKTVCLDEGRLEPDANEPYVFSYEMIDMPMFLKIMKYFIEHPELDQQLKQNIIWKLSRKPPLKFEDLLKEERDLLLKIDSYADGEIDNYKSIKYEPWQGYPPELWPKKIVPQPIPGTGIFAKIQKTKGFSQAIVEFYNPTPIPQKIILLKSNPGALAGRYFNALRQRLGFTTPGGETGLFERGGLGGMAGSGEE